MIHKTNLQVSLCTASIRFSSHGNLHTCAHWARGAIFGPTERAPTFLLFPLKCAFMRIIDDEKCGVWRKRRLFIAGHHTPFRTATRKCYLLMSSSMKRNGKKIGERHPFQFVGVRRTKIAGPNLTMATVRPAHFVRTLGARTHAHDTIPNGMDLPRFLAARRTGASTHGSRACVTWPTHVTYQPICYYTKI